MNALLKIEEAADELRVSTRTVRSMIERKELAAIALPTGGSRHIYRVPRYALDDFLATHSLRLKKEIP